MSETNTITQESVQAFTKGKYPAFYFIRHVFYYLREFPSLLEDPDYKRLYEETLAYQVRHTIENCGWEAERADEIRRWMEFLADLVIRHDNKRLPRKDVERYLEHRRAVWNGEK